MSWRVAYAAQALRLGETLIVAMSNTPLLRLLEADVCRDYYRLYSPSVIAIDDSVPEDLCKIAAVQKLVADVNGPTYVLNLIPALLAALPYLLPKQLLNKKKILLINVAGSVLMQLYYIFILYFYNTFNPRWIWLSGMFSFIGGGDLVFFTLSQALIAESIPTHSLSAFYLYSSAIALSVRVAGLASGLSMMTRSIWLPILISISIKLLDIPIIVFFLDGPDDASKATTAAGFRLLPTEEDDAYLEDAEGSKTVDEASSGWRSLLNQNSVLYQHMFVLGICALQETGDSLRLILPYWLSRRFHASLQEVGYVHIGELLLTAAVVSSLPRFSRLLERPQDASGSSAEKDLVLAKLCLGFSALGTVLLGFSWYRFSGIVSLVVLTGGAGFRDSYLSFVTAELKKEEIAQMYMVISMVALSAISVGGSLISELYSVCLQLGDSWFTSLPIWFCALPIIWAMLLLHWRPV